MSASSGSVGTVRNGSEPASGAGRPPVMNDEQLLGLCTELNARLGRPPRAEELIQAAGGCQRSRALSAIKALKLDLARRAVRSQITFPPELEQALRAQLSSWLDLASRQLSAIHLDESERTESKISAYRALIDEIEGRSRSLAESIRDRDRILVDLRGRAESAEAMLTAERMARAQAEAVATERERIIAQLTQRVDSDARLN